MSDRIMLGLGGDSPMMLSVLWSLTLVATLFVGLRLYTRLHVLQSYGWDDHFFNASYATLLIYDVMMTISSMYGFGRDMTEIIELQGEVKGMEAITHAILYSAIGQTVLVFGTALSKISLGLFLLRLTTRRRDQIAIWIPNFFLSSAVVISLFVFWFSCEPRQYLWDRRLGGSCPIDPGPISMYAGSWSVIVDFWYAAFPWLLLWNVQMPRREKFIIATSLSLGVFAGACGIKRAIELRYLGSPNYLKDILGIIIWHAAELCTTLVCIGIPVCRPLFKSWYDKFTTPQVTSDESKGSSGPGVFALHTIGGSEYTENKSQKSKNRSKAGYEDLEDDEVVLRKDIQNSRERQVIIKGAPRSDGEASGDNASEDSILRTEWRQSAAAVRQENAIEVRQDYRLAHTRSTAIQ
ncbi:hypothetical protein LIA77_10536 [Sarocladium implicatum]|nr:hypothetical protein LIA77_10536 [Sarocladium implicatum]